MSHKHSHDEECDCEHHKDLKDQHNEVIKCPTDLWVDNLIKNLKKEFDKDIKEI
ncbi:MAG: hypothetical protein ACFFAH_14310 [Promethearchaeota archaeon]